MWLMQLIFTRILCGRYYLSPFYKWGNCTNRLNNLPKTTELSSFAEPGFEPKHSHSRVMFLSSKQYVLLPIQDGYLFVSFFFKHKLELKHINECSLSKILHRKLLLLKIFVIPSLELFSEPVYEPQEKSNQYIVITAHF